MYLRRRVSQDEMIGLDTIQIWPQIVGVKCHRNVEFALKDQPAGELINAEVTVDVCPMDGACVRGLTVQAVLCPKETSGKESAAPCHAIIAVPERRASELGKAQRVQILLSRFP